MGTVDAGGSPGMEEVLVHSVSSIFDGIMKEGGVERAGKKSS